MSALQGQVALVTGASRGIGRAIAVRLGALGAQVVIDYRSDEQAALQAAREVAAAGGPDPLVVRADVADPEAATALVQGVLEQHGRLDVLVNNAGIQRSAMAHRMVDADWHDVIAVNLSAVFFACRAALPAMRQAGRGHIVNIASASSVQAQPGACSYVASKHGLIGLTKALALENAGKGVRVHAVAPGLTDTDLVRQLSDEQRASLQRLVPLGRLGRPEEVAAAVAWLVTEGSYTTGNTLHVSGGVVLG
ncbi:MAG: 3-oxoacyl-ACP reductase FabG [Myxococcales bacterium]|nr:3-oxoacyl-ACP reductase FabG [Myxococcales bacterium]